MHRHIRDQSNTKARIGHLYPSVHKKAVYLHSSSISCLVGWKKFKWLILFPPLNSECVTVVTENFTLTRKSPNLWCENIIIQDHGIEVVDYFHQCVIDFLLWLQKLSLGTWILNGSDSQLLNKESTLVFKIIQFSVWLHGYNHRNWFLAGFSSPRNFS